MSNKYVSKDSAEGASVQPRLTIATLRTTPGLMEYLEPCKVLPDDIRFLREHLPNTLEGRLKILDEYKVIWADGAGHAENKRTRQNKGRFAANSWLRNRNTRKCYEQNY